MKIPFNRPTLAGREYEFIAQALANNHISGDGRFTKQSEALLQQELDVPKVLLTTSGTHALEMAALLLDIQPGDEVIVPSFTFTSTINAFVLRGARPIFIDIRPDTLNMDETQLEGLITPRTRAIVPVHYAGVGCEMDTILAVAGSYGVAVVEDNAHGLFGKYHGRYLGTFGCMATQSFHETKNFTCGEGGALLINHPIYVERAEMIREKGTNRSSFFRGEVDKYSWLDLGSSYLPSEILAAFLYAQLEARQQIQASRRRIWEYYSEHLQNLARDFGVQLPFVPPHCEQAYHIFFLLLPFAEEREAVIRFLDERKINSVFHYLPLHHSEMAQKLGSGGGDCPVTVQVSERLVRLPFYNDMTEAEQSRVVQALYDFAELRLSS